MKMIPMFLKELEQEAQITRKMLSIVPNNKFDWQRTLKACLFVNLPPILPNCLNGYR